MFSSQMFQPSVDPKYKFDIINKKTSHYLDLITQEDYKLLIELLVYLDHPALNKLLETYGAALLNGEIKFNNEKFEYYKNNTLKERMESQGYTFFKLINKENNIVALASGNFEKDDNNLRLLNLVVHSSFRGKGVGTLLLSCIGQYMIKNSPNAEIVIPISPQSQQKSLGFYEKVIPKIASSFHIPSPSQKQVEIFYKPRFNWRPEDISKSSANTQPTRLSF